MPTLGTLAARRLLHSGVRSVPCLVLYNPFGSAPRVVTNSRIWSRVQRPSLASKQSLRKASAGVMTYGCTLDENACLGWEAWNRANSLLGFFDGRCQADQLLSEGVWVVCREPAGM